MSKLPPIPQEWIRDYIDSLLAAVTTLGPDTPMGRGAAERADHAMDLVKAFRDSQCEHNWVDASNEIVKSGHLCTKCGRLKP